MNQKLRTARYGIAILLAILCIVCLSLSLAFSAHFAAFAEGETTALAPQDSAGNDLWLVNYTGADGELHSEGLWSGIHDGEAIKYLAWDDETASAVLREGTDADAEKFYYAPYRATDLTLTLNGEYSIEVNGETKKMSELYNLQEAKYQDATRRGGSNCSEPVTTSVTVESLTGEDSVTITKQWMVATLCNAIDGGLPANYLELVDGSRGYATTANVDLLAAEMGNTVIYHFIGKKSDKAIAVVRTGEGYSYYKAYLVDAINYSYIPDDPWEDFTSADAEKDINYINYTIRRLTVDNYTLKVVALSPCGEGSNYAAGGIYYASSSQAIDFEVVAQPIDGDSFLKTFGSLPVPMPNTFTYTGNSEWLNNIDLNLSIDGLTMVKGTDYSVDISSYEVGFVDLRITGQGNLKGTYTIPNAIQITPAINDWDILPSITPWKYGDYDKAVNKIVGLPKFPLVVTSDNINDITFRIVEIGANGVETNVEGLESIHFVFDDSGEYLVSNEVAAKLAALNVGGYRMYASVYGVTSGTATTSMDRDYYLLEERFVNFNIIKNENGWNSENGVPSIVSWTAGKYDPAKNVITAVDKFGNNATIVIKNGDGDIVYSNDAKYADQPFGKLDALKKFKAGYYTLEAKVKGTDNYGDLDTVITFTIARNGLPTWAVILIVVGALGVVALTFGLLHQKGVLQMLTGKVIISMRTRANVDATLAAIRAAKMARDAEASIAAAKAREAEEAAKEKKDNK